MSKFEPQAAGRVLMVGLPGPEAGSETIARLRRLAPGGVILFGRNLDSPAQCVRLIEELRASLPYPLLLALDQEGGRVSRLEPWIGSTPTAAVLARAGADETRRFGAATGRALRSLGFDVDFAPVVDLCGTDATNGIGDRSFGLDPETVRRFAGAFLEGLQGRGVAGCLKHFPGLGPTSVDSHETLPTSERDAEEIKRLDLDPYRALGQAAATVMVGHGSYPGLDPARDLPATLSRPIVTGLLRDALGFGGLVVSDDLEMGAVAPLDDGGQAAVRAIDAGCDLVLYCAHLERAERAAEALARAANDDSGFRRRIDGAVGAVEACAGRWVAPALHSAIWEQARDEIGTFTDLA